MLRRSDAPEGDEARAQRQIAAADAELRGLHAKLFVVDQPYWSHIYTGSANATDAAFDANVEFLVELKGRNTTQLRRLLRGRPGRQGDRVRQVARGVPAVARARAVAGR